MLVVHGWCCSVHMQWAGPTCENMHQLHPSLDEISHSLTVTELEIEAFPDIQACPHSFQPHYLLVIIALTLSVSEINHDDFSKVNGCKESKNREKLAMLSNVLYAWKPRTNAEQWSTDFLPVTEFCCSQARGGQRTRPWVIRLVSLMSLDN